MSDFAGLWRLDGAALSDADLSRLAQGLGGSGLAPPKFWKSGSFALVHRQHVFTPEDRREHMPLVSRRGGVLAADIRLDDRAGLARTLDLDADQAARPDGALAAYALDRWGEQALPRLYGDFSIALWDPQARSLLLARSPSPTRTLYVHRSPNLIAFSTRLRALLALPDIPLDIDEDAVADQLILSHGLRERTLYRAIDRVPMAHRLLITADRIEARRWWSVPEPGSLRFPTYQQTVEAAREVLNAAVASATRAVGPVGALLTAGLDSTAITLTAHRQLGAGRVVAMTRDPGPLVPPDGGGLYHRESVKVAATAALYPDLDWIAIGSEPLGHSPEARESDARRWYLEGGGAIGALLNASWFFPLYRHLAGRGGRVLLAGDLGNAFFSSDGGLAELALLRQGRVGAALRLLMARSRYEGESVFQGVVHRLLSPYEPLAMRYRRKGWPPEPWGFFAALNPAFAAETRVSDRISPRGFHLRSGTRHPDLRQGREWLLEQEQASDWFTAARAVHGLDVRLPLVDRRLVELFAALPQEVFVKDGVPRSIARDLLAGLAPPSVVQERQRGLQGGDWFITLSARRPDMLAAMPRLRASALASRIIDLDRLERCLLDWPETQAAAEARRMECNYVLSRGFEIASFLAWRQGGNH